MTIGLVVVYPEGVDEDQRAWKEVQEELALASPDRLKCVHQGGLAQALEGMDCDLLWIHDIDLLLPFQQVLDRLRSRPQPLALKPFGSYLALTQSQSREDWRSITEGRRLGLAFGKSSYVIERQLLKALGGFDPTFQDVSEAGFDLARRLRRLFPEPETLNDVNGVALYRPRPPHERQRLEREKSLRLAEPSIQVDQEALDHIVRREAWKVIRPTPPTPLHTRLPGSLWGLTTFFNPHGYASKLHNYRLFRRGLEQAGMPLCCVELAFEDRPFEVQEGDADQLVRLRGADVLWQKERLLNIGVESLPADCDKVAWLDCDVLFDSPEWAVETARALETFAVVQPFSRSVRLWPGETGCEVADLPLGSAEHEILHGVAWGVNARGASCLHNYHQHGHTGYAWAARREILQKHGLYDCNILGNADLNIAQAMYGGCLHLRTERLSPAGRRHLMKWAEQFYSSVRGSVGWLEGVVFHLWHGSKADRLYDQRLSVLIDHDYDPARDVARGPNGAYRWASDKPALHAWCRDYFAERREDAPIALLERGGLY